MCFYNQLVTFKDLKNRISIETTGQHRLFERLRNKSFWIWDIERSILKERRNIATNTEKQGRKDTSINSSKRMLFYET
jgi:hypothetical protein